MGWGWLRCRLLRLRLETETTLLQASQLPQGLCAMQAVQRSVGECFGAVDQVLITAHPLDGARCGRGRGCAATERHFASGVSRRKGG